MTRVVVVFGLAGSGKSTLANGIGQQFGLRVIHPSGIMRDLLEKKTVDLQRTRQNDGYWETEEGARILADRLDQEVPVDLKADKILLEEVEKGEVVIDSWSLPWLTSKGLRIHLLADLTVRARRAAERGGIPYQKALERISAKDEQTRQLFLRLYGFDIKQDHHVFEYTLDTDELNEVEVLERACAHLRSEWGDRLP